MILWLVTIFLIWWEHVWFFHVWFWCCFMFDSDVWFHVRWPFMFDSDVVSCLILMFDFMFDGLSCLILMLFHVWFWCLISCSMAFHVWFWCCFMFDSDVWFHVRWPFMFDSDVVSCLILMFDFMFDGLSCLILMFDSFMFDSFIMFDWSDESMFDAMILWLVTIFLIFSSKLGIWIAIDPILKYLSQKNWNSNWTIPFSILFGNIYIIVNARGFYLIFMHIFYLEDTREIIVLWKIFCGFHFVNSNYDSDKLTKINQYNINFIIIISFCI